LGLEAQRTECQGILGKIKDSRIPAIIGFLAYSLVKEPSPVGFKFALGHLTQGL
jgi:hypothetical protein